MYEFLVDAHVFECTIEDLVHGIGGYVLYRSLNVEVIFFQYGCYLPEYHLVFIFSEWQYCSVINAGLPVGNNLFERQHVDVS